jgi:hypothetical protein
MFYTNSTLALLALGLILILAAGGYSSRVVQTRIAEYRRSQAMRKLQEKRLQRAHAARSFHAVSIVPARPCCKLVRRYTSVRYLTADAPHLPLAGCRAPHCGCRSMHHEDRRIEDRRNPFGIDHVPIGMDTNRRGQDRRRAHKPAAASLQH